MGQSDGPGGKPGEKSMTGKMAARENKMRGTDNSSTFVKPVPDVVKYKGRKVTAEPDKSRIQQRQGKNTVPQLVQPIVRPKNRRND